MQTDLFESIKPSAKAIVNVASVPQRSPFRYAGGKTWLIPRVRIWLQEHGGTGKELIEPFAGGGIVSLTAAFEQLVDRVTMVELDEDVAAVWETLIHGNAQALGQRILSFNLSAESARQAIEEASESTENRAFATIIRNRVNHGGILASGSGFLKNGENGKGIHSRWYPETLHKRIEGIIEVRDQISFVRDDAFQVMAANKYRDDAVYFIDPPYVKAGKRLYRYAEIDHEALFVVASELAGNFLMTYDNNDFIRKLADKYHFEAQEIAMKNTHNAEMTELLIGRNLSWFQ